MTICDVRFYFNIKYINKASAGGIRSMYTDSYTHIHVCRTQTHLIAYNSPHKIEYTETKKDGSVVAAICEHRYTAWTDCLHDTQVTWSQEPALCAPNDLL